MPQSSGANIANQLRTLNLPFPTAYVLPHPEYEVLFLPCLQSMDFPTWDRDSWEDRRGIKEWLSAQLPRGKAYKPTVNQLPMTRKIDIEMVRKSNVPSFGSLERGLRFLRDHASKTGVVYP